MTFPELTGIPTIALTATRDLEDLSHLAFERVLKKPASIDGLIETLAQLGPSA